MSVKDKLVLCISGFDPSAGAGILADVKAVESTGAYAMGVISANTIQTEDEFIATNWVKEEVLLEQLDILLQSYKFKAVKIGIVESLDLLRIILQRVKKMNDSSKIIWDPVLKSSSGFDFHNEINKELLKEVLGKVDLITPNLPEYEILYGEQSPEDSAESCALLLKGGHSESEEIIDQLYFNERKYSFIGSKSKLSKHGTGCVLSSVIAGNLVNNYSVEESCKMAKEYLNYFIESDNSLLGKHKYEI